MNLTSPAPRELAQEAHPRWSHAPGGQTAGERDVRAQSCVAIRVDADIAEIARERVRQPQPPLPRLQPRQTRFEALA